ncbi:hypothetical protein [Micromonospora lupini]|uniref:hypothetical protein n=1 Tax=Micromonospora lupini TaxID=285679 RepID=UPI0033E8D093
MWRRSWRSWSCASRGCRRRWRSSSTLRAYHRDARPGHAAQAGGPARTLTPDVGTTSRAARVGGRRSTRGGPTADRRRDIHALTRQHERGALTDAEFAAALAKIRGASGG